MIYQEDLGLTRWYIVFQNGEHVGRIWNVMKDGFRHCWAFTYDPITDTWLRVDATHRNIVIRPVANKDVPLMLADVRKKILVVYDAKPKKFMWKSRLFVDCASVIGYLVGVDVFFHTPWRLFCALRKNGGQVNLPKGMSLKDL